MDPSLAREQFRQLLCTAGLAEHAQTIAGLAQVAIGLTQDQDARVWSRLGGRPRMPVGQVPTRRGEPLRLLAQLDLAELHPFDIDGLLPRDGVLSFFLCDYLDDRDFASGHNTSDRSGFAVIHTPESELPDRADGPPPPDQWEFDTPVRAQSIMTWPDLALLEMEDLDLTEEQRDAYWQLSMHLRGYDDLLDSDDPLRLVPLPCSPAPEHRLLGTPDHVQSDTRPRAAAMLRGIDEGREPTVDETWKDAPEARQWRLLLQLGEGESFTWCDGGAVYFNIRINDLAAARFDRCWFEMQSG
ncbi:YwqG family protein [Luteococcus sp. H138]|uniref:YwqG family protein n=1 Tax=unclassified Luteococcus TaxID=2639923 RepID=UPI00313BDE76